ncbi:hypothetical protein HOLleu_35875 [Holothuria leucospilota]|uniref:Uncharacterized protein n=1 Tax=Holothuria leucospilota TaxID=206669 RepID=A0A9Q0YLC7_HOLLE|nr:hypothetical protein HOLleu_35875 [Holothuria leucospilota]
MHRSLLQIFLVGQGLLYFGASAIVVENISSSAWDGVGIYISVKRETIQKKLDLFNSPVSSKCGDGPKLFLPDGAVFPDLHNGQHPVYLDVGFLTSHDFDQYLANNRDPCIKVSGLEVSVTIPFLAGNSGGPPIYALAQAKFYEKSRGDFPKTNFLYPYIPVDEIKMDDFVAVVKNGSDEMRFSFNRLNLSCKPPVSIVTKEFDGFVLNDLQFGLSEPEFSFCDRHSFVNDYCHNAARVRCDVHRNAPNVCLIWRSGNEKPCITVTTVEIQNITSGLREIIPVGDDPINVFASESFSGDYTVGLKYPCQE